MEWGWCKQCCLSRKAVLDNCSAPSYYHRNITYPCEKSRLRQIRQGRGFDQYADQYQKISGWTQWTRQLFLPVKSGHESAGKHLIAGLFRTDASSHAAAFDAYCPNMTVTERFTTFRYAYLPRPFDRGRFL